MVHQPFHSRSYPLFAASNTRSMLSPVHDSSNGEWEKQEFVYDDSCTKQCYDDIAERGKRERKRQCVIMTEQKIEK